MNLDKKNIKIAIIGAGIAGCVIANKLSEIADVVLFDKSRGVGGRMTTKRAGQFAFDHGAQFFTAKSEEFKNFCQTAIKNDIVEVWQAKFVEIVGNKINRKWQFNDQKPHFVAKPQMNNLCKYLVKDLSINLNQEIVEAKFKNDKWSLKTAENEVFEDFDYLILAIPSHQAVNLIPDNFKDFDMVKNTKMVGCFSLMLGFKNNLNLAFDAALVKNSIISWVSVNSSKPQRQEGFSLLINSSNSWAEENIEENLEIVKEKLISQLQEIINFNQQDIEYKNIHRWRYANVKLREGKKSLFDPSLKLGVCGDWLISGRVEHAFLSGLDLFSQINGKTKL